MNVVKPSDAHERMVTTKINRAIAPGILMPRAADARAARVEVDAAVMAGSTARMTPPTSSAGTINPSVPASDHVATRNVISGGPSAIPTLPPSENHESAVALRSPA